MMRFGCSYGFGSDSVYMGNGSKCFKITSTFSLSIFKENGGYQGLNSQNACQNSKQGSSLIWVCAVSEELLGRQVVFKIFEHLL